MTSKAEGTYWFTAPIGTRGFIRNELDEVKFNHGIEWIESKYFLESKFSVKGDTKILVQIQEWILRLIDIQESGKTPKETVKLELTEEEKHQCSTLGGGLGMITLEGMAASKVQQQIMNDYMEQSK